MATTTNFKQSAHAILVALLNASNAATSLNLAPSAIAFGAVSPVAEGAAEDTAVTASAQTGSGYRGSVDLQYKRVNFNFMETLAPGMVIETDAASTLELVDYLDNVFGIQLEAGDLVDTVIPALRPDENTPVVFSAGAQSKVFVGSVTINLTKSLISLPTVVLVTTLDGLYAPS